MSCASPVAGEKQPVIRVVLKAGDVAYNPRRRPPYPMGNRSELIHLPYLREGDERWYRWRVYFPSDFAVTDGKNGGAVIVQWLHWSASGEPGSPPLLFTARTDDLRLVNVPEPGSIEAVTLAQLPQKKGQWREFVFHVRFSSTLARSLLQLWVDGERVPVKPARTLFPGYEAYLKIGLYRRPTALENNVIFFDEIMEATSRADVDPSRRGRP